MCLEEKGKSEQNSMQQQQKMPISIFCAAAPEDVFWLTRWEKHLLPLQRAQQITVWSARHILPGLSRMQQIHEHLDQAQVVLFLLSSDFFAADECCALVTRALAGNARVLSVLVRPVDWGSSPLHHLASLPSNGQFVVIWPDQDHALQVCVHDLQRCIGLPTLPSHARPQTPRSDPNRTRMLRRLRKSYEAFLHTSLQDVVRIELELAEKAAAVSFTASFLFREAKREEHMLAPGTTIVQAYEAAEQELLILGEPGAGKSTLLAELGLYLLRQAETDETLPLPVIVPLAAWAARSSALPLWVSELISHNYDIPRGLSEKWVQQQRFLLLLDGLDEMHEALRPTCLAAINAYHETYWGPLVVCSRTNEYMAASEQQRLALQSAIVVQPLSNLQVSTVVDQVGEPVSTLRQAMQENTVLQALATTPLMLHILLLTYQGTSVATFARQEALLSQQVWDAYVQRMVERKGSISLKQTRLWLGWLAQQMRAHDRTHFYLEHLQPDWLMDRQRRIYHWLGVRLPAALIGALVSMVIGWFFLFVSGWLVLSVWQECLQDVVLGGLLGVVLGPRVPDAASWSQAQASQGRRASPGVSLVIGLLMGLSVGWGTDQWLLDELLFGILFGSGVFWLQSILLSSPRVRSLSRQRQGKRAILAFILGKEHFWRALLVTLFIGLSYGMSYRLSYVLGTGQGVERGYGISNVLRDGMNVGLSNGLSVGLCFGLASMLMGVILSSLQEGIYLRERVRLTWRNLRERLLASTHCRFALLVAGTVALCFGLNAELQFGHFLSVSQDVEFGLSSGLSFGSSFGLLSWLVVGFYQSIDQERIEDEDRRVPNEGIRRSLQNSLLLGPVIGVMIAGTGIVTCGLSQGLGATLSAGSRFGFFAGLSQDLGNGLSYGLAYGLSNFWTLLLASSALVWIITGGLAAWRHYLIRFLLQRTRTFPWNAFPFLHDAQTRILLQYLRGGYSFIHRLLLDFLADAYEHEPGNFEDIS